MLRTWTCPTVVKQMLATWLYWKQEWCLYFFHLFHFLEFLMGFISIRVAVFYAGLPNLTQSSFTRAWDRLCWGDSRKSSSQHRLCWDRLCCCCCFHFLELEGSLFSAKPPITYWTWLLKEVANSSVSFIFLSCVSFSMTLVLLTLSL